MGSFNILSIRINCSECNASFDDHVQFKYGNTWQFEYKIGDKLMWGGNQIGKPDYKQVKVYGITTGDVCPICNVPLPAEYDIIVEYDVLTGIFPMRDYGYWEENDGCYKVIEQ